MSQELIFTVLPHQRIAREGQNYLKLSIYVTVRLESPKNGKLADFEDILNWPERVANNKYIFEINGGTVALPGELQKAKIDGELYKRLLHRDIRVDKFIQEDMTLKKINSFPVKHVKDFILKNYTLAATEDPINLIGADKLIDEDRFGLFSPLKIDENELNNLKSGGNNRANSRVKKSLVINRLPANDVRTNLQKNRFVPVSKQINPVSDLSQFRNFHKLDREKIKVTPIIMKKPEFEFHDIVAVSNSYPQVMRKLGFILDFELPLTDNIPLSGTIRLQASSLSFTEEECFPSFPSTAYEITKSGFYTSDKVDSIFKHGFVRINTNEFSVVQIDTDGVALKAGNMAENKVHQVAKYLDVKSKLSVNRSLSRNKIRVPEPPEDEGLPFMRSAGIAITKNGMAEHIYKVFNDNKVLQTSLLKSSPFHPVFKVKLPDLSLYSSDIIQGYRMDIAYSRDPEKWFSLHQRKDEYRWYDKNNKPFIIEGIEVDEGYIELGIAEDPNDPGDIFISETLARWEGWSLSVGKPGYAINEAEGYKLKGDERVKRDFVHESKAEEDKKYAYNVDSEFRLNVKTNIVPGTLPKLRFGKEYRIRIRAVDLAGNSVPLTHVSEDSGETTIGGIKYMRYEPLSSPIMLTGNVLKDGEFSERMVIRSNFDSSTAVYENKNSIRGAVFNNYSERFLLPPKNSQLIAETHGMFEKAMGNFPDAAATIYDIIKNHEGLYEKNKENKEVIYKLSDVKVIYLPDPMAAGVAIFLAEGYEATHTSEFQPRLFSFYTNEEIFPTTTNVDIPSEWYNAKPLTIRLEEGTVHTVWDGPGRTFTVYLPQGYRTKLKISTFWREKDMKELSAIWQMIKESSPLNYNALEKLAKIGQHWMVSPSKEIELVHAVQQPVEEPIIKALIPIRDYGDTTADINTKFTIHGESTEKVEFQAKWIDPLDDTISVTIKESPGSAFISDIEVHYHDDIITRGTIPPLTKIEIDTNPKIVFQPHKDLKVKTEVEFKTNPQPEATKVNVLFKKQMTAFDLLQQNKLSAKNTLVNSLKFDIAESKFNFYKDIELRLDPLSISFEDTKHRWVDFKIVAASRYRDYFDKILKNFDSPPTTRESKWVEKINILSTIQPAIPEIDYVIPTFEWQKTQNDNAITHKRLGGGLRVFLKRPWCSTGPDEMLAVILPPTSGKTSIGMVMDATREYNGNYTYWGLDPLHNTPQPDFISPKPSDFRLNPLVDDNLQYPNKAGVKANAMAYPVHFDETRQQWFCDLAINPDGMYFPFIKLALARYQPHSVRKSQTDCCLSPIVLAEMIQLMPDRQATIQFRKEDLASKFTVTIEGLIYQEKLPSFGIFNFFRISLLDSHIPQPGYGIIGDNMAKQKLEDEKVEIEVSIREITGNRFKIIRDFKLPSRYRTAPFSVIIEEYERGPKSMNVPSDYKNRIEQSDETDKIVYADVFKINEPKS
ncbi:MAG: hypothetical protein WCP85_05775 [Mariniphaga sp.]